MATRTMPASRVEALCLAVASGQSAKEWAEANGVAPRTVARWLAAPSTRERINELQSEIVRQTLGNVIEASGAAVARLRTLLDAPNPPGIQLSAAKTLLDLLIELQSHLDLNERLAELERRFNL